MSQPEIDRSKLPFPRQGFVVTFLLTVTDKQRSTKFYTEILGMTVYRESDRQVFMHAGHQGVALFQKGGAAVPAAGGDLNHLALNVAAGTYDSLKTELEGHGIAVRGRPGDDHCLYLSDPDGHRLQLIFRR